jgi:5-methylcytosine-specific restriction protein A
MTFDPELEHGAVLTNSEVAERFECSQRGGMRRSLSTNTLVLISNHIESIYCDRWLGSTLHYTGMGRQGNQRLDATQNRTLAESPTNDVEVHLFEVDRPNEYTYRGRVRLVDDPYSEPQPDRRGQERIVWMFPLELVDGPEPEVSDDVFRAIAERKRRQAHRLSEVVSLFLCRS